ncbi:baseplate J/gp47 family protein [Hafnia alvei]|nr:baseplate J/gp47 family protein [Hafnia alvei]MBI0275400.1 baseplate J/gp47 family protein [Hafnia alvei]PNK98605.1 hypothetical protein CEQ28_013925 [Hafnia alvei]
MSTPQYGVTVDGFIRKPLSVIIDSINKRFTAAYGSSFDTSPESPDGQTIGIVSDEIDVCWGLAQSAYNAYRPGATFGIGLDNICELNNVRRYVNTPTTIAVQLIGSSGTLVPAGSIVGTDSGEQFSTNVDTYIPNDVTATCTTSGEIYVAAGAITKIITPITGWTGVSNSYAGVTGVERESDPKLRSRREKSTITTGTNTVEAIYDALSEMGLEYIRIRDNDSATPIGSQPAYSFHVVVSGGNQNEIAQAIFENKPAGIQAYGTTTVSVKDSKGYPHSIGFSRPQDVPVYISITFKRGQNGSSNDAISSITTAITNYVSLLQSGESVVWSYLFTPIVLSTPNIEIDSIFIGLSANPTLTDTITMDIFQKAKVTSASLVITDITDVT